MAIQTGVLLRGAGRIRRCDGFPAEDHRQAHFFGIARGAMLFAQLVAQLGQQRVVGGAGQVVNVDLVGEPLAASSTHRNENASVTQGPGCHGRLGPDLITGVNHSVHASRQKRRPIVSVNKGLDTMHLAARMKGMDSVLHSQHLGLTHRGIERMNLAVDVGFADVVKINQGQTANGTARQRLGSPRANAADTNHCHMRRSNSLCARVAIQACQAGKTTIQKRSP